MLLKSHPPTTAPMMPKTMSARAPVPGLFTILLAIKPEISPRTIHAKTDMETSFLGSPYVRVARLQGDHISLVSASHGMPNDRTRAPHAPAGSLKRFRSLSLL